MSSAKASATMLIQVRRRQAKKSSSVKSTAARHCQESAADFYLLWRDRVSFIISYVAESWLRMKWSLIDPGNNKSQFSVVSACRVPQSAFRVIGSFIFLLFRV